MYKNRVEMSLAFRQLIIFQLMEGNMSVMCEAELIIADGVWRMEYMKISDSEII